MAALRTLLSWLALLFHLLFCLSGARHLRLEMPRWSGSVLAGILLFGPLTVILAIFDELRFVWSLAVAAMLTKALILVVCAWIGRWAFSPNARLAGAGAS